MNKTVEVTYAETFNSTVLRALKYARQGGMKIG